MKKAIGFILIFLVYWCPVLGQSKKYEREYRLDKKKVPQQALDYINAFPFDKKIKWYKEEGLNRSSIEAKTKFQSKKVSIEFNIKGVLEDIEVEIKKKELSAELAQAIDQYLSANYSKHKICKIQIQYTGDSKFLQKILSQTIINYDEELSIHYEIVAKVKQKVPQMNSSACPFALVAAAYKKRTIRLETIVTN